MSNFESRDALTIWGTPISERPLEPLLPSLGQRTTRDAAPQELLGATILFVGSCLHVRDDQGYPTLVIDYRTTNGRERRLHFAFTDLGMWVEKVEDRPAPSPDAPQE